MIEYDSQLPEIIAADRFVPALAAALLLPGSGRRSAQRWRGAGCALAVLALAAGLVARYPGEAGRFRRHRPCLAGRRGRRRSTSASASASTG